MAGLAVLVISDQSSAVASVSSKPFLGDCLALLGATLYAVTNVTQEKLLGKSSSLQNSDLRLGDMWALRIQNLIVALI